MPEKPSLTYLEAKREYPDEFETVMRAYGWDWNYGEPLSPLFGCPAQISDLGWAAVAWLSGKMVRMLPEHWVERKLGGGSHNYVDGARMPSDPLRWWLEEVREHLKRERDKIPPLAGVKVVVHSPGGAKSQREDSE